MSDDLNLVGNKYLLNLFDENAKKAKHGSGSIILLSGESGFGKTHILNYLHNNFKSAAKGIKSVFSEGQAPIGKFNVGNIQPLIPFTKAIEHFLEESDVTPEKRFAKNVGLTLLASIPLIDTVFYAVKEIGRDWRQFKTEKSSEKSKNISSATADYFDSLQSLSDKMPFIIIMDDMHWADAQSVELLSLLAEHINQIPLMIVLSYKRSLLETQGLPLMNFLMQYDSHSNVKSEELDAFSISEISELSASFFKNYKQNDEFEEWILEHSYGVPGVAAEYLRYFQKFSPFGPDGQLATNFKGNEFLPSTVQTIFTQQLDTLSEDEKNTLAICSAEGREFTALVVSQLLNTDVLSTIKKLKSLQNKTGLIKSLGPENRYGVKTTVFKFNQAFYHNYFENSLEYEEYTALHGQIAAFLKTRYDQTDDEMLREDLAPYLAAHSLESGDEETAKAMLLLSAKHANKYGNSDVVKQAFDKFSDIRKQADSDKLENLEFLQLLNNEKTSTHDSNFTKSNDDNNENQGVFDSSILDFKLYVKSITNDIVNRNYDTALDKTLSAFSQMENSLSLIEKVQLLCLQVKCYGELHKNDKAEQIIITLGEMFKQNSDEQPLCLYYNAAANYYYTIGNLPKSYYYLDKSANIASKLPQELRLLTIANIALTTRNSTPDKAKEYLKAARQMSKALNFDNLFNELN